MAEDVLFEFLHMEIVNLMYDSSAANDEQVQNVWQYCSAAFAFLPLPRPFIMHSSLNCLGDVQVNEG